MRASEQLYDAGVASATGGDTADTAPILRSDIYDDIAEVEQ